MILHRRPAIALLLSAAPATPPSVSALSVGTITITAEIGICSREAAMLLLLWRPLVGRPLHVLLPRLHVLLLHVEDLLRVIACLVYVIAWRLQLRLHLRLRGPVSATKTLRLLP